MKKKLTLLQQALAFEKKLKVAELEKKVKQIKNNYELLNVLLPNYKPQLKQKSFHLAKSYEKGLKGGYGSGKTIALCAEAIAYSYLNRPLPVVVASPSEDIIQETTYRTLKELCLGNDLAFDYSKTDGCFKIFFADREGIIYLIGQVFFKGPNIAALGLDEPFSQRKEVVENLIARVRSAKAKKLGIFWSGTAEPDKMEWGTEYFEKDEKNDDLFTITIPTIENKYLPDSFVKTLKKKYDAKTQEIYLEGKLVLKTSLPVYNCFNRKNNITENLDLKEFKDIILSFDFNVDPMTCVMIGLSKGTFYQTKEWHLNSSNTTELCAAVIAYLEQCTEGIFGHSIIITGDATGRRRGTRGYLSDYEIIRDEFTRAGINYFFNVPKENPAVRDRINFVNKLFESERFFIDSGCIKSIKDRELVSWKQSAEGFMVDKSKKDLTHLSDCGDYAVYNNQMLLEDGENAGSVYLRKRISR